MEKLKRINISLKGIISSKLSLKLRSKANRQLNSKETFLKKVLFMICFLKIQPTIELQEPRSQRSNSNLLQTDTFMIQISLRNRICHASRL